MKKNISLFRDATIKGCAIVMSLSASVMLLQGCASMDLTALLNSNGNPAMLANLVTGFRIPNAPSGQVEKVIFYADATKVMSDKLIEQQQSVIDELAVALGYKGNEKTAEQLAEFMGTVDGNSLTPSQKHTIKRLAPEMTGLVKVGATTLIAAGNIVVAAKPGYEKVKDDMLKAATMVPEIVGAFNNGISILDNVSPIIKGFSKMKDSYDNLASAAGIAKLSPAEEKAAEKKALVSTAGSGASYS